MARKLRWRGGRLRMVEAKKSKFCWMAVKICRPLKVRAETAANWMPSGNPSII